MHLANELVCLPFVVRYYVQVVDVYPHALLELRRVLRVKRYFGNKVFVCESISGLKFVLEVFQSRRCECVQSELSHTHLPERQLIHGWNACPAVSPFQRQEDQLKVLWFHCFGVD